VEFTFINQRIHSNSGLPPQISNEFKPFSRTLLPKPSFSRVHNRYLLVLSNIWFITTQCFSYGPVISCRYCYTVGLPPLSVSASHFAVLILNQSDQLKFYSVHNSFIILMAKSCLRGQLLNALLISEPFFFNILSHCVTCLLSYVQKKPQLIFLFWRTMWWTKSMFSCVARMSSAR
jgi:hypothetical protein